MHNWSFQEWWLEWSVWAIGLHVEPRYGWDLDQATIYLGPVRLTYLKVQS